MHHFSGSYEGEEGSFTSLLIDDPSMEMTLDQVRSFARNLDPNMTMLRSKKVKGGVKITCHCSCRGDNCKTPKSSNSTTMNLLGNPTSKAAFWEAIKLVSPTAQCVLYNMDCGDRFDFIFYYLYFKYFHLFLFLVLRSRPTWSMASRLGNLLTPSRLWTRDMPSETSLPT